MQKMYYVKNMLVVLKTMLPDAAFVDAIPLKIAMHFAIKLEKIQA